MELGKFFCAKDKLTGLLTRPFVGEAFAARKYKCLDEKCKGDVIFCAEHSVSVRPYFRHVSSGGSCQRFSKPTEKTIHDEAAMVAKSLLETQRVKVHTQCMLYGNDCGIVWEKEMPKATVTDEFILKDRYDPSNCRLEADLSWYSKGDLSLIVEIKHTHATEEGHRPEPWIELQAEQVLKCQKNEDGYYVFENIRNTGLVDACDECLARHKRECEEAESEKKRKEKEQKLYEKKRIEALVRNEEQRKAFLIRMEHQKKQDEHNQKMRLEQQEKDNEMLKKNKQQWLENERIKRIKYDEEQAIKELERIENEKFRRALQQLEKEKMLQKLDTYLKEAELEGQKLSIPKDYLDILVQEKEVEQFIALTFAEKTEQLEIHELCKISEVRNKRGDFDF